jgi:hypothetical protein
MIPSGLSQTPQDGLLIQPFLRLELGPRELILIQPSSSAIVSLLGLLTVACGVYFLKLGGVQHSRRRWGTTLLLWGIGALLAGMSYEAFSYVIKCAGRAICLGTSGWKVLYLIASVWSIDAMVAAEAWSCAGGRARRAMFIDAGLHAAACLGAVLQDAFRPVPFLFNLDRYVRSMSGLERASIAAWLCLGVMIAACNLYDASGLTQPLWRTGTWFSGNDVLHPGLIVWMIVLALAVAPRLEDQRDAA